MNESKRRVPLKGDGLGSKESWKIGTPKHQLVGNQPPRAAPKIPLATRFWQWILMQAQQTMGGRAASRPRTWLRMGRRAAPRPRTWLRMGGREAPRHRYHLCAMIHLIISILYSSHPPLHQAYQSGQ